MAETMTPAGAAVPASALTRLTMTFSGRAWVEVRDKNGKIIHSQNNMAGADQVVEGEAPLSLVIGSAPNVKLMYKGKPVDLSAFAKADVARLTLE
jgi:cytoskeleton protein RodZ